MFKNQKVSKNTYLQKVEEPEDKQKYLSVAKCLSQVNPLNLIYFMHHENALIQSLFSFIWYTILSKLNNLASHSTENKNSSKWHEKDPKKKAHCQQ